MSPKRSPRCWQGVRLCSASPLVMRPGPESRRPDTIPPPPNGSCLWCAIIIDEGEAAIDLDAMVGLLRGQKWHSVTPLIGWLAVNASVEALNGGVFATLDVLGLAILGAATMGSWRAGDSYVPRCVFSA